MHDPSGGFAEFPVFWIVKLDILKNTFQYIPGKPWHANLSLQLLATELCYLCSRLRRDRERGTWWKSHNMMKIISRSLSKCCMTHNTDQVLGTIKLVDEIPKVKHNTDIFYGFNISFFCFFTYYVPFVRIFILRCELRITKNVGRSNFQSLLWFQGCAHPRKEWAWCSTVIKWQWLYTGEEDN